MYINYNHRVFGLDVIRALAIIMVLCSHSTLLLFPNQDTTLLTAIRFFGAIGVDLFFVLSGFLIGGIILKQLKEGKVSFKDFLYFWTRRWFRTLPNYFLILILNILVFYFLHDKIIVGISNFFLFLQNFSRPHPDFFTESWSLSIEEYAYLIGPFLLYLLILFLKKSSSDKLFLFMILMVLLTITFFRLHYHCSNYENGFHNWSQEVRKVVIYRVDSIYYGFLGSFFALKHVSIWEQFKKMFFGLGLILFVGLHMIIFNYEILPESAPLFYNIFYLPIISISLLMFFPVFSSWKKGRFLKRQVTHTSVLSYAIYLVNYSLVLLTINFFIDVEEATILVKLLVLIMYWVLSFYLGYLLYKYFEKPVTNLRDSKFIKDRFINT